MPPRSDRASSKTDRTKPATEQALEDVLLPEGRFFSVYLRDLTAERHAETEMQRQREALQQSEKMAAFSSLLAGVAHDLNNCSQ